MKLKEGAEQVIQCRRCQKCVYLSMITSLISSLSVFFVVRVTDMANSKENSIPMYIVGAVFWAGLALTYLLTILASRNRKRAVDMGYGENVSKRAGFFCLFSNIEAKTADIVMICSVLLIIIELVSQVDNHFIILISIFSAIYSLHMHGILNGRNYYYVKENKDI